MIPDQRTSAPGAMSIVPTHSESCPICTGPRRVRFQARLLNRHDVRYLYCGSCGLLQTEAPYWFDEAYSTAIVDSDTGLLSRNLNIAVRLASLVYFCFDPKARYLDFAGGYGVLTRLMRDRGFDFYWQDPYCKNVFARGFEWENIKGETSSGGVTAFEVLEHVPDPLGFVRSALEQARTSNLIFSTLLYEGEPPAPEKWWYYALETGQHISFFRRDTLITLANKLGLHLHTNGWLHVLTAEEINPVRFRFCSSRFARLIGAYVQLRMRSKTFDDHNVIVNRQL